MNRYITEFKGLLIYCLFLLFSNSLILPVLCQNAPEFKLQLNLEAVTKVYNAKHSRNWLVQGDDHFTWIDSRSKLQFGSNYYVKDNSMAPNNNRVLVLSDHSFLIMHPTEIVQVTRGGEDKVIYKPEDKNYVINISFFDAHQKQLLIHTKSLVHKSEDKQSFVEVVDDHFKYDTSSNCALLVLDLKSGKVLQHKKINKQLTALENYMNGKIYAGSFKGELLSLKKDLSWETIKTVSHKPIHSIYAAPHGIYILQHKEKRFLDAKADGEIFYLAENGAIQKTVLPIQTFKSDPDNIFQLTPTNEINTSFISYDSTSLFIGFGFDGVAKLNHGELNLPAHYKDSTERQMGYYGYTNFGRTLLTLNDNLPNSPFETSSQLGTVNFKKGYFRPFFIQPDAVLEASKIQKTYDKTGNYHFILNVSEQSSMGRTSTYVIYSSNKAYPTTIRCEGKLTLQDTLFYHAPAFGSTITIGAFDLSQLIKENYSLRFNDGMFVDENFASDLSFLNIAHTYSNKGFQSSPSYVNRLNEDIDMLNFIERKGKNYDKLSNKVVFRARKSGETLYAASFPYTTFNMPITSSNGRYFAVVNAQKRSTHLEVWDWKKSEIIFSKELSGNLDLVKYTFNREGEGFYFTTVDENWKTTVNYVDLKKNAKKLKQLTVIDQAIYSFKINEEQSLIGYSTGTGVVVRNYTDQAVLFSKETNGTDRVELDKNGFTFNNGTDFITWTFEGETIEFIPFESKGGIEILNGSIFKLTKNALNNIAFVYRNEILPAKQYEAFVNDPLQVLKVSGSTNTTYHEVLKTAQKKRENHFKKHAIEDVFNTENKCEIVNINGIPDYTEDSVLLLNIECHSKAGVQSLHIAVNGVPVVGKNGTQYANQPNSLNDSLTLLLSTGVNKIEVFFYDREGIVVYAPIITIEAAYSSPERMYFLGIGIDEYANPELNLKWCKKDILDLASALSKSCKDTFTLDTLFNQNVTLTNISAIRSRLECLGVNDKLIVSYSGHGVLDSTMNYYLSTHGIDFLQPAEKGIPYELFESLLDGLAVRKRLVMIDACHSGIVDPSSFEVASSKSSDLALKGAIRVQSNSQKKVDETTSFELMQELFYITGNDIGATIVSAAAGNQYAYEKSGLENGVFTYSVLDVLRTNSQLFVNDLERLVGQKVIHLTKGLQKPTSRKVNTDFNWVLF